MANLKISNTVILDENEVEIFAIRAQGSGVLGKRSTKFLALLALASSDPDPADPLVLLVPCK